MGVNSFFEGTSAVDITVRQSLIDDPQTLALGRIVDGVFVENGTAMLVSQLQSAALDGLGERSPTKFWSDQVQAVGSRASTARTQATATTLIRESLDAQRAAAAGVSIDEESINLINYQQQYSAAARVIQIADELMDILINIV
jgi:flagellar hook-associated protein 1 FlgK